MSLAGTLNRKIRQKLGNSLSNFLFGFLAVANRNLTKLEEFTILKIVTERVFSVLTIK